ncbi:MAG TPA: hypothetical protein VGO50_16190 [Pyrinomonadaceae bacterium]|nr:hypothetical protein [Pyrinomonadaceae bacterium]
MNDIEITLMMIAFVTGSLSVFIYIGSWLLHTLKTPDVPLALQIIPARSAAALNAGMIRRRVETKPGIICSLPIHQRGRSNDLPF